ncbi:MAG TPA: bifunctional 4-hydroxy-2-oxoglutarate aldolase/2-dehydro-3-deoxy-phosphogluconate aldolase [Candidatus Baltobacteraceae bacterium]|jgi:2-dehydro-3-deoxyphosphogluconate aldolase/(4S)-4-hydroxy-2-oxoglutarate aldolase|nr:bifunctional 4-hydroxy-2-oxoglutarate aldolase/2-dehydro-3-deoxy-phosphogluconate aldolase [Candidatus Baltobacteraceae bacterium]
MRELTQGIETFLALAPVVPVVTITDPATAVPLARSLVEGGLPVIEIALRTPCALEAIRCISTEVPDAVVGAGTVLSAHQCEQARTAGAKFLVSPGATDLLVTAARACGLPFLPGIATAGEAMRLLEMGFTFQKFFPAETAGGVAMIKALGAPLPQIRFCPTGGISPSRAAEYLRLDNVICVGGSWLTTPESLVKRDWSTIFQLAQSATKLR